MYNRKFKLFLPNIFMLVMEYLISLMMFYVAVMIIINLYNDIFVIHNADILLIFIMALIVLMCFPTIFHVVNAKRLYYNDYDKIFKIGQKTIPFSDILGYSVKYGLKLFPKCSMFALNVYLILKNDEKVSFQVHFRGAEIMVRDAFKKIGINRL